MRKHIVVLSLLAASAAFGGEKVKLWPKGLMPDAEGHQIAAMTNVSRQKDFNPDEWREPYLEWFDSPAAGKHAGVCMILISGGSYQSCCDVRLVYTWAKELTDLGVQCVNLVYRTPRPKGLPFYKSAWEDGQRAVRLVRRDAERRGFSPDKIGAMSMSAGSHLATLLATSSETPAYAPVDEVDETPCNLDFACAFAPAFAMTDGLGMPDVRDGDPAEARLDDIFKFDGKTCPMFLSQGGNDIYSPSASTHIYRGLRRRGVPAELHLYPKKGHGAYGFDRAVEFMRQMKFLPCAPEEGIMGRFKDDGDLALREREYVWPRGKTPDEEKEQCVPYIEWFVPSNLATRAIQIVYSGGSYLRNDPDGFEVAPVRRYLNAKGMAVVTLKYRTPRPKGLAKHDSAWADLQRAVRLVRAGAKARGLDPDKIGIMGSSAGGHLTLMGATSSKRRAYWPIDKTDKIACNVQWAVAIYPAYALTDGLDAHNTTGGNDDLARLAPEFSFDVATPPMLFIHGDADGWAAMNSVKAWEQLRRMGIEGELHTLATRKHCFQNKASPGTGSYTWIDRIWEFLTEEGFVKEPEKERK